MACSALIVLGGCDDLSPGSHGDPTTGRAELRLAVLGDSDSHSYADRVNFPLESGYRGGRHRANTLQWTEVLARLRSKELDPGPWGMHGTRRTIAKARALLGLTYRAAVKQDYAFNFALSGARCEDLMSWPLGQARQLRSLIDSDPAPWRGAIVTIRIGINDIGTRAPMDAFAARALDSANARLVDSCVRSIRESVELLEASGAGLRFVLVGILNNADWPRFHSLWHSRNELRNIAVVLDAFDGKLRDMAVGRHDRAFFDDRAWFAGLWGGRDANGLPDYRDVTAGGNLAVTHSEGDEPDHSVLLDGHAGLIWNALWARDFLALMNRQWNLGIASITDDEIGSLLENAIATQRLLKLQNMTQ